MSEFKSGFGKDDRFNNLVVEIDQENEDTKEPYLDDVGGIFNSMSSEEVRKIHGDIFDRKIVEDEVDDTKLALNFYAIVKNMIPSRYKKLSEKLSYKQDDLMDEVFQEAYVAYLKFMNRKKDVEEGEVELANRYAYFYGTASNVLVEIFKKQVREEGVNIDFDVSTDLQDIDHASDNDPESLLLNDLDRDGGDMQKVYEHTFSPLDYMGEVNKKQLTYLKNLEIFKLYVDGKSAGDIARIIFVKGGRYESISEHYDFDNPSDLEKATILIRVTIRRASNNFLKEMAEDFGVDPKKVERESVGKQKKEYVK